MPGIAHLDTTALDTAAKFFRTMQKVGADFTAPMQSIAKRRNLADYLALGCPKVAENGEINAMPKGQQGLARLILGDDLITPEEVVEARNLVYSDKQFEHLSENFPSVEDVAWCLVNDHILVPAPPRVLSILGVRDLNSALFASKEGGWYPDHPFSREDLTPVASWMGIRKDIVRNSTCRKWKEQTAMLSEVEVVPNAAEFAWGLTTYREVRGTWFVNGGMDWCRVWCRVSSVGLDNRRVVLGVNRDQLLVNQYGDDEYRPEDEDFPGGIGVSASRRFGSSCS